MVLGLAGTSILQARDEHDASERWVRVLRLYGLVGCAMQALGVGEAPLETPADDPRAKHGRESVPAVDAVADAARDMALQRGAPVVGTVDILFACFDLYGSAFDRALYLRGTSREELLERIAYVVDRVPG